MPISFDELARDLCEITGYDKISFQPNRLVFYSLKNTFKKKITVKFKVELRVNMLVSGLLCNT